MVREKWKLYNYEGVPEPIETEHYRYLLSRRKSKDSSSIVCFVLLNPSTASPKFSGNEDNDPTTNACQKFAEKWNCDGFDIVNLYAYKTTYPLCLIDVPDPVGCNNEAMLDYIINRDKFVVAAWGENAGPKRVDEFLDKYGSNDKLRCITELKTKKVLKRPFYGPRHPMYLSPASFPASEPSKWINFNEYRENINVLLAKSNANY